MKPEAEKAIRTIDDLITWLADKKIIRNQAAIDRLSGALKVIAENCEHDDVHLQAQINSMAETVHKLKLIARGCGLTAKGIALLLEFDETDLDDFVRHYTIDDNAKPLNFPLMIELFKVNVRVKNELEQKNLTAEQWN